MYIHTENRINTRILNFGRRFPQLRTANLGRSLKLDKSTAIDSVNQVCSQLRRVRLAVMVLGTRRNPAATQISPQSLATQVSWQSLPKEFVANVGVLLSDLWDASHIKPPHRVRKSWRHAHCISREESPEMPHVNVVVRPQKYFTNKSYAITP